MNELQALQQEVRELKATLNMLIGSDRYIFQRHLQLLDGKNIIIGGTTGSSIGASNSKIAFYGGTPVALQTGVGVNAAAIHAALVNLKLITA